MCSTNYYGYWDTTEANQTMWADRYTEERMTPDLWWLDLGWFTMDRNTLIYKGFFDPNPEHYPKGLKALSDHVHKQGTKLLVWFEPEHLYPGPGNWLCENHPEWLLSAPPGLENVINQGMPLKNRKILNLGNPEALRWLTDRVDTIIHEQGIDHYRHDFNIEPLVFWRHADAPDRQGITENRYVQGFLGYYDELLRRHPGMFIDNCASGGRRNDVETLRRSIPLLRSDTLEEPLGQQCQSYGLFSWLPFCGTGIYQSDPKQVAYIFRSQNCPHFTECWDIREKGRDYSYLRELIAQWRSYAPYLMADYYPLTPYSHANTVWMAWQFDQPGKGEGLIQAFRRGDCAEESLNVKLQALDREATYSLKDLDTGKIQRLSGKELMGKGLEFRLKGKPGSVVVVYRREHYQAK
jgi:alpha-galactosidase